MVLTGGDLRDVSPGELLGELRHEEEGFRCHGDTQLVVVVQPPDVHFAFLGDRVRVEVAAVDRGDLGLSTFSPSSSSSGSFCFFDASSLLLDFRDFLFGASPLTVWLVTKIVIVTFVVAAAFLYAFLAIALNETKSC